MKALQSLTDLFKSHVTDAAKMDVWAEDGALFCGQGADVDGFEIEYTAIVFLQSAKLEPQVLFMHLVSWLNKYDPERAEKGLPMPTFALEPLDKGAFDLKLKIDIREEFDLQENEQGNWKQGDTRYECVSGFEARADEDQLGELVHFVGHLSDLP